MLHGRMHITETALQRIAWRAAGECRDRCLLQRGTPRGWLKLAIAHPDRFHFLTNKERIACDRGLPSADRSSGQPPARVSSPGGSLSEWAFGMLEPPWTTNWVWALPVIALTLMLHAEAVVLIAVLLVRIRRDVRSESWSLQRAILLCTAVIVAVGGILALLHGLEAGIWAALFLWLRALASPADAMLYSLDSITTRGESGLILEHNWRLRGRWRLPMVSAVRYQHRLSIYHHRRGSDDADQVRSYSSASLQLTAPGDLESARGQSCHETRELAQDYRTECRPALSALVQS
jgi:hypothetical protein